MISLTGSTALRVNVETSEKTSRERQQFKKWENEKKIKLGNADATGENATRSSMEINPTRDFAMLETLGKKQVMECWNLFLLFFFICFSFLCSCDKQKKKEEGELLSKESRSSQATSDDDSDVHPHKGGAKQPSSQATSSPRAKPGSCTAKSLEIIAETSQPTRNWF